MAAFTDMCYLPYLAWNITLIWSASILLTWVLWGNHVLLQQTEDETRKPCGKTSLAGTSKESACSLFWGRRVWKAIYGGGDALCAFPLTSLAPVPWVFVLSPRPGWVLGDTCIRQQANQGSKLPAWGCSGVSRVVSLGFLADLWPRIALKVVNLLCQMKASEILTK